MNFTKEECQVIEEALYILVEMQDESDEEWEGSERARIVDDIFNKVVNS